MGSKWINKGVDNTQTVLVDCGLSRSHLCRWQSSNDTLGKIEFSAYQFRGAHTKFDEKAWSTDIVLLLALIFMVSLWGCWILYLLCYIWKILGPGLADMILLCPCYGPILLCKMKIVAHLLLSGTKYFLVWALLKHTVLYTCSPRSRVIFVQHMNSKWIQMFQVFIFYFFLLFNENVSHSVTLESLSRQDQLLILPSEFWD